MIIFEFTQFIEFFSQPLQLQLLRVDLVTEHLAIIHHPHTLFKLHLVQFMLGTLQIEHSLGQPFVFS